MSLRAVYVIYAYYICIISHKLLFKYCFKDLKEVSYAHQACICLKTFKLIKQITVFYFNIFQSVIYFCYSEVEFSASLLIQICWFHKETFLKLSYYQHWKWLFCLIFWGKCDYFCIIKLSLVQFWECLQIMQQCCLKIQVKRGIKLSNSFSKPFRSMSL